MTKNTASNRNWVYDPPVSSVRSSQTRAFVYVLLLPNKLSYNETLVPFYVGITSQLNKRLSNHKEINWYVKRFKEPVRVHVLGTVIEDEAFQAAQDLVRLLLKNRYYLNAHLPSKVPFLKKATDWEIKDYTKHKTNFVELVEIWKTSTEVKGLAKGKTKTPPPEPPDAPVPLTKTQLVSLCEKENYGSQVEKNLILNIAHDYDEKLGYSKYWLSSYDIKWIKTARKNKLTKIFSFPTSGWGQNYTFFRVQKSFINKHS